MIVSKSLLPLISDAFHSGCFSPAPFIFLFLNDSPIVDGNLYIGCETKRSAQVKKECVGPVFRFGATIWREH